MEMFQDLPVLLFEDQSQWRVWLEDSHALGQGAWLKIAKKASGKTSITYSAALDEALCYGWIDATKQKYDDDYFLQKFTPRRPRSIWSKVNVGKCEALIKSGKMQPAGLAAIEAAKANGAWEAAYDAPSTTLVPADFQMALNNNPKANLFFQTLNKANVYAFCWRIQTAKRAQTRQARIHKFVDMLERGEKLY